MKNIPVDQLQQKTKTGLQIKVSRPGDDEQSQTGTIGAHRDDHYIFFLLTKGLGTLKVDLQDITITAGQLYYILPSQVHYKIQGEGAEGWFLAVDTSLIPADLRGVFEHRVNAHMPSSIARYELQQYSTLLNLLHIEYTQRQGDKYYLPILHTLVQSFLAMAASTYDAAVAAENKLTRSEELAREFKALLAVHSNTIKSPSAYASKLHVSTGYLNETIKKVTGSTVTYWIQQELFNEAKRLLYHTDDDVKQIAQKLGYADYAYFSRSFRKASGMSPLKFRGIRRK
jgi:AraC family transcriptional activator of pobA